MTGENFTCICKVTHCLGPQLLFEKVNFNGRNQIGGPVYAHSKLGRSDRQLFLITTMYITYL